MSLSAARAMVQYAAGLLSLAIGQELLTTLRERILVQVQRLDLTYHWRHGVGKMVTRMTRDADKVRDALINFSRQMFETGLMPRRLSSAPVRTFRSLHGQICECRLLSEAADPALRQE